MVLEGLKILIRIKYNSIARRSSIHARKKLIVEMIDMLGQIFHKVAREYFRGLSDESM